MIRPAVIDDADVIADIIISCREDWRSWAGEALEKHDHKELAAFWVDRIANPENSTLCYDKGEVLVVSSAGPERDSYEPSSQSSQSAHLSTFFARPTMHGSGVSAQIHDALLTELKTRKCTTVRLWVPAGAARARSFYARKKWAETGKTTMYAGLERLEMRRDVQLGQSSDQADQ